VAVPATSAKQFRLMEGVAHGSIKRKGLSPAVANEFVDDTPARKRSQWSRKPRKAHQLAKKI